MRTKCIIVALLVLLATSQCLVACVHSECAGNNLPTPPCHRHKPVNQDCGHELMAEAPTHAASVVSAVHIPIDQTQIAPAAHLDIQNPGLTGIPSGAAPPLSPHRLSTVLRI